MCGRRAGSGWVRVDSSFSGVPRALVVAKSCCYYAIDVLVSLREASESRARAPSHRRAWRGSSGLQPDSSLTPSPPPPRGSSTLRLPPRRAVPPCVRPSPSFLVPREYRLTAFRRSAWPAWTSLGQPEDPVPWPGRGHPGRDWCCDPSRAAAVPCTHAKPEPNRPNGVPEAARSPIQRPTAQIIMIIII